MENKNVILIDDLALTTGEPYRTYLSNKLNCNVLDYPSFFEALVRYDAHALYLIDKERLAFLKLYLKEVHGYHLEGVRSIGNRVE